MQLSPTYRAVLTACPDLNWIYRFIPQLGRGRCSWVHGLTKAGAKVSRFLKKGLIKAHTWLSDSEVVSTSRDRIYTVSQDECTCPEWKHRISQGKGYRHIPELFKGYVSVCKHQVQHWLRSHDVSHFSEFIHTTKINLQDEKLLEILEQIPTLPEGLEVHQIEGDMGWERKFSIQFNYWKTFPYGKPEKKKAKLGSLLVDFDGALHFRASQSSFWHEFEELIHGINYLMKVCGFKLEQAIEPDWEEPVLNDTPEFEDWEIDAKLENCDEDIDLFEEIYPQYYKAWKKRQDIQAEKDEGESLKACRDLFGDDFYPEPVKDLFGEIHPLAKDGYDNELIMNSEDEEYEKEKELPVKPQKKWLSFSDLTG